MSLKPIRVALFLGSARTGRMAERAGKFIARHLRDKGYEVDLFDPLELKIPLLEQPIHFYQDKSQIPDWLIKLDARVRAADTYVVVSPEYNGSIPPALSNTMNHFPPHSYAFKPSFIVTYSASRAGGAIVGAQLRNFLSILACPSIPFTLTIPAVHTSLDEEGKTLADAQYLEERARKGVDQLDWMAKALKERRIKEGTPEFFL